jgi:hypothetical protein
MKNDYKRKCDWVIYNSELDRLGCSGCHTTHEAAQFSAYQLGLEAKVRVCIGLEGRIMICEHYSFSGLCILRGLREFQNSELFCQENHIWDISGKFLPCLGQNTGARVGYHAGNTVTIDR